jgi:hypothetical protein
VAPAFAGAVCVLAGHDLMQAKGLSAYGDSQQNHQKSSRSFILHEVTSNPNAGAYSKSQSLDANPAFCCEVTKEYLGQITDCYSRSRRPPATL